MSTVTDRRKAPAVDKQPIDTELIADSTDAALRMKLGTSTRESIDIRTTAVIEQLNQLLGKDLDADEDPDIRSLVSRANKLLELSARPTKETPAFSAFFYMRDVASLTRRLLWVCPEAGGHAP